MDVKANACTRDWRTASEAPHCPVVVEEIVKSHIYYMSWAAQGWFYHVGLLCVFSILS